MAAVGSTGLISTTLAGGDILRAVPSGNTFVLESNGSVGGLTSANGVGNTQGPGGGEFYADAFSSVHEEVSVGGVSQIPGYRSVANSVFDPNYNNNSDWRAGGLRYLSNITGTGTNFYEVYDKCDSSALDRAAGPGS